MNSKDSPTDAVSQSWLEEEETLKRKRLKEDAKHSQEMSKQRQKELDNGSEAVDTKYKALEYLLNQSKLYSTIMLQQMQQAEEQSTAKDEKSRKRAQKREEKAEQVAEASQRKVTRANANQKETEEDEVVLPTRGRGRPPKNAPKTAKAAGKLSDYFKKEQVVEKAGNKTVEEVLEEEAEADIKSGEIGAQSLKSARQPKLVTGGTMRTYQLEGLEWLRGLYENGLNGILADEMGLGKTIQTISFLAFLWERESYGPFLIAAPLSTTSNWVAEFERWTPDIPVVLYHGSRPEREKIRKTRLRNPGQSDFPVVVTSYEICMNDRKFLANFGWKFIIIDEGHRIKNLDCRLIRDLQSYQSANRLLITGTPLQNNLTELWSLLHFLMPSIFDSYSQFESWFDFSALKDEKGYEQLLSGERQKKLVSSIHAILKPFLLRRVKRDVETNMPRKREYVLFAPLTVMQRELYQAILDGMSREYLEGKVVERLTGEPQSDQTGASSSHSLTSASTLKRKAPNSNELTLPAQKSAKSSREATPSTSSAMPKTRKRAIKRKNYEEVSDAEWFRSMDKGELAAETSEDANSEDDFETRRNRILQIAKRQIGQKKLQNALMQLRLCCNSPYNFFNPFDLPSVDSDAEVESTPDDSLVSTSGKMMLLDQLLPALFERGHKVLLFSQFKSQLDLIELYATTLRNWRICRIDGSVPQSERQAQILAFNRPGDGEHDTRPRNLFLLSTRAGGQGINLAAADTVILFDSDWNPQQDLQAQDRAHRIGQTKNVIVYRFATRGTVEQRLLQSAGSKRRLEKLVIRKGGVGTGGKGGRKGDGEEEEDEMEELRRMLRREDGESVHLGDVLGEGDLRVLLDRSEGAYERAEKGEEETGGVFRSVVGAAREGDLMEGLKA
ncbi:SWI/SNF chromatin remodeling complex component [Patellaria atrata CBS 101060]|uniref:SWI/SNF chromatin remodeling complex component n=1 Tax=Patellaria atrata CBS 101060 TaxID=1346257 RepID=A0A9P4S7E0_9PEZI|nr:SWI/SNF chromatin remodeling complex component [Patellaria atrata CBS 101060]